MLQKEAIEEYKKLYEKCFGIVLTDAEASFRANNLVNLYKAVLTPEQLGIIRTDGDNGSYSTNHA